MELSRIINEGRLMELSRIINALMEDPTRQSEIFEVRLKLVGAKGVTSERIARATHLTRPSTPEVLAEEQFWLDRNQAHRQRTIFFETGFSYPPRKWFFPCQLRLWSDPCIQETLVRATFHPY